MRSLGKFGAAAAALLLGFAAIAQIPAGDWRSYGRDPAGTHFSPLAQITRANVGRLAPAWSFDMHALAPPGARLLVSQMMPLAIGGRLYLPTPYGALVALDGDSGRQLWTYALPGGDQIGGRALEYWDGGGRVPARLFFGTRKGLVLAIDPRTGTPAAGFMPIDLKTPEVMAGAPDGGYQINSAPVVAGDVLVTGARVQESPALGPSGDIRGWDARTGRLLWTFHTIPQPGEFGHDTWRGDGWRRRSGVNVWNLMSVDTARGIVFAAIGAPAYDRIGVDRPGANLFSSTLVALDARTGKRLWHFQLVHHDIWDLDVTAQPTLVDVRRGGQIIPAIVALNKQGLLFVLDRRTGKPLFDVRETPVPPSSIPGEEAWPTQPIPVSPPPLVRQSMDMADLTTLTPAHRRFCLDRITNANATFAAQFEPLRADRPTIRFPGSGGGVNLGSGAYDRTGGLYVVNTLDMGSFEQMGRDADGNWANTAPGDNFFRDRATGWLCQKEPWGSLVAVDVSKGVIAWRTTLGVTDTAPAGKQDTGRPSVGGPIVTAGGLAFIGATDDNRLRAFDLRSGRAVWTTRLPASAHTTPITYAGASGRQYLAIVAAGGSYLGSPASASGLYVFALPTGKPGKAAPRAFAQMPAAPPANAPPGRVVAGVGSGEDIFARRCTACHVRSTVSNQRQTAAEWRATVEKMVGFGAQVSDAEIDPLVAYLARAYPPK